MYRSAESVTEMAPKKRRLLPQLPTSAINIFSDKSLPIRSENITQLKKKLSRTCSFLEKSPTKKIVELTRRSSFIFDLRNSGASDKSLPSRAWSWRTRGNRTSSLSRSATMGPQRPLSQCGRSDVMTYCPPGLLPEDAPVDFLEGWMDLTVYLPSKKFVRMSVERRTPMMDLLIQVTTAHKINPGGHVIQVMNERSDDYLFYKPSTPIGALDTSTIHIIPKQKLGTESGMSTRKVPMKALNLPFESTFRLQIRLPKNQLYVLRVSPKTTIQEVLTQTCNEKGFDKEKYEIRHPDNLDERLLSSCRLADYQLTEVVLVSVNHKTSRSVSTSDILKFQQIEANSSLDRVGQFRRPTLSHTGKTRSSAGDSSLSSGSLHDGSRGDETPERSFSPFEQSPRQRIMASTPDLSGSIIDGSVISSSVGRMKKRRAPPPPSGVRPMSQSVDKSIIQRQMSTPINSESQNRIPDSDMSVISVCSINSGGKKRRAPVPPKRTSTTSPPPNVCAIPEETPSLLIKESSSTNVRLSRANLASPAPAPRTSLETGIRPISDIETKVLLESLHDLSKNYQEISPIESEDKSHLSIKAKREKLRLSHNKEDKIPLSESDDDLYHKTTPCVIELIREPSIVYDGMPPGLPNEPPPERADDIVSQNGPIQLKIEPAGLEFDSCQKTEVEPEKDPGYGSLESKHVLKKTRSSKKEGHDSRSSLQGSDEGEVTLRKPPSKPPRTFTSSMTSLSDDSRSLTVDETIESAFSSTPIVIDDEYGNQSNDDCKDKLKTWQESDVQLPSKAHLHLNLDHNNLHKSGIVVVPRTRETTKTGHSLDDLKTKKKRLSKKVSNTFSSTADAEVSVSEASPTKDKSFFIPDDKELSTLTKSQPDESLNSEKRTERKSPKSSSKKSKSNDNNPSIPIPSFRMVPAAQVSVHQSMAKQLIKSTLGDSNGVKNYDNSISSLDSEENFVNNLALFTPGNLIRARIAAKECKMMNVQSKDHLSGGLTEEEKSALEQAYAEKERLEKLVEETKMEKARQILLKREEEDCLKKEKIAKSRNIKSSVHQLNHRTNPTPKVVSSSETLRQQLKNVIGVNFNQVNPEDGFKVDFDDELLPCQRSISSSSSSEDEVARLVVINPYKDHDVQPYDPEVTPNPITLANKELRISNNEPTSMQSNFEGSSSAKAISDALEESFAQIIDFEEESSGEEEKKPATVAAPPPYEEKICPSNSVPSSHSYEFSESSADLKVNFSDSEEDFSPEIHGPPTGFQDLSDYSFSETVSKSDPEDDLKAGAHEVATSRVPVFHGPMKFSIRSYKDRDIESIMLTNDLPVADAPLQKAHTVNSPMEALVPNPEALNIERDEANSGSAQNPKLNKEFNRDFPPNISQKVLTERLASPVPPPLPLKSEFVKAVRSNRIKTSESQPLVQTTDKEKQKPINNGTSAPWPIRKISLQSDRILPNDDLLRNQSRRNGTPVIVTKPYIPERRVSSLKASSTNDLDKTGFVFDELKDNDENGHVNVSCSIQETLAAIKRDILNEQEIEKNNFKMSQLNESPFGTLLLKKKWKSTQHVDADYQHKPKTTLDSVVETTIHSVQGSIAKENEASARHKDSLIEKKFQNFEPPSISVLTWKDRLRNGALIDNEADAYKTSNNNSLTSPVNYEKRSSELKKSESKLYSKPLDAFNISPRPWAPSNVSNVKSIDIRPGTNDKSNDFKPSKNKSSVLIASRKPNGETDFIAPYVNKNVDNSSTEDHEPQSVKRDSYSGIRNGSFSETKPQFYFGQTTPVPKSHQFLGQLQTAIEKVKFNEALTHPKLKTDENRENKNNLSIITDLEETKRKKASSVSPGISSTVSSLSSPTSSLSSSSYSKNPLSHLHLGNKNHIGEEEIFVPRLRKSLSSSQNSLASSGRPMRISVPNFGSHTGFREEPESNQEQTLRAFERELAVGKTRLRKSSSAMSSSRPLSSIFDVHDVDIIARPPPPPQSVPPSQPSNLSNPPLGVSLKPVNGEIPLAPKLRQLGNSATSHQRKGMTAPNNLSPREELLEAIRGKGGVQGLKKTNSLKNM